MRANRTSDAHDACSDTSTRTLRFCTPGNQSKSFHIVLSLTRTCDPSIKTAAVFALLGLDAEVIGTQLTNTQQTGAPPPEHLTAPSECCNFFSNICWAGFGCSWPSMRPKSLQPQQSLMTTKRMTSGTDNFVAGRKQPRRPFPRFRVRGKLYTRSL